MKENYKKDFSLLRPFDSDAVRNGEKICWYSDGEIPKYFILTPGGSILANFTDDPNAENIWPSERYRMVPLCWVEGKPVYKGDVLYHPSDNPPVAYIVDAYDGEQDHLFFEGLSRCAATKPKYMTWAPPKVKREGWVNIYPDEECVVGMDREAAGPYPTEKDADNGAVLDRRIACVRIEWEE